MSTLCIISDLDDCSHLPKGVPSDFHILGGGTNVLLAEHLDKTVIKVEINGPVKIVSKSDSHVIIRAQAGMIWNDLVQYALHKDFGGLENLSMIPGTVGAAPVQNIGAYGVEQDMRFVQLEAFDLVSRELVVFNKEDCCFSYRDSLFKSYKPGRYIILSVDYVLTLQNHIYETSYGAIRDELAAMDIQGLPSMQHISKAVITIRQSKLPDPSMIPNAGSFFKNPIIYKSQYQDLLHKYPTLPCYPISKKEVKVPAGWLIDQAGWKGKQLGHVATHDHQALVIVNKGGANGKEIAAYANRIAADILEKYGILLIPEVNYWNL